MILDILFAFAMSLVMYCIFTLPIKKDLKSVLKILQSGDGTTTECEANALLEKIIDERFF